MAEAVLGLSWRQMTSLKTIPPARIHPARTSRTGYGAASVIPHLNVGFPPEPAELSDSTFDDPIPDEGQTLEPSRAGSQIYPTSAS
jgi:hypothetical protein